jgi:hypothetical protein
MSLQSGNRFWISPIINLNTERDLRNCSILIQDLTSLIRESAGTTIVYTIPDSDCHDQNNHYPEILALEIPGFCAWRNIYFDHRVDLLIINSRER